MCVGVADCGRMECGASVVFAVAAVVKTDICKVCCRRFCCMLFASSLWPAHTEINVLAPHSSHAVTLQKSVLQFVMLYIPLECKQFCWQLTCTTVPHVKYAAVLQHTLCKCTGHLQHLRPCCSVSRSCASADVMKTFHLKR
jgi:hypothetical protein